MANRFKTIANSKWFQASIIIVIIFAGILVGAETYSAFAKKYHDTLLFLDRLVLMIFSLEIVIKILAEGRKPWRYFYDGWNIFDFTIVAAAFMPFAGSSVTVLRLLRLLRVLRLVNALPKLQLLVGALLKSLPSMLYVTVLLLLLFYVYAVAGVFFFGENDPFHFGNLQKSMLSLFRVVTLEDWTDIMYINMLGCSNYGYDIFPHLCKASEGKPILSVLFFVSFVLVGTMIILNLFIGVIMNGMEEAKIESTSQKYSKSDGLQKDIQTLEIKLNEMQNLLEKFKKQNT